MDLILILSFFGVIGGLVGLWWASDKAVELAIHISKIFGWTTFFIGFVFIAVATGLPEMAIAIASLWDKVPSVAAGDIIGSNFIDISLVLGAPAVFVGTLNVRKQEKLPLMLMLIIASSVMAFVFIVGVLNRSYGFILIALYFASIWWLWGSKATKIVPREEVVEELSGDEKVRRRRKALGLKLFACARFLFSLALVMIFSKISIDSAIVIVRFFSLNFFAIGATIFAVGTSLPELVLSIQAVRKKEYALAFGNAFGSVLEQATLILGALVIAAKKPIDISVLRPIAPLMFLSYAIVVHAILKKPKVGRQEGLGKKEGAVLLILFVAHLFYFLVYR
jgi:cation:H+ antiporter